MQPWYEILLHNFMQICINRIVLQVLEKMVLDEKARETRKVHSCQDIPLWTTHANLLVALKEKSEDH